MSATHNATLKSLPKSMVEITVSLPVEAWEKHRAQAVKELNEDVRLDGFRQGKIPESVLVQRIGEHALLESMAEIAVSHAYAEIAKEKKIHPVGRPKVELTKIAKGNPLEFRLTTAVLPTVILPDYKAIAKKYSSLEDTEVTDKEVDETVTRILEMRAHEGHDHEKDPEHKESAPLPELTDEYAKTLGKFENVADFKAKLRTQIGEEKRAKAKDKRRNEILEAVAAKTTLELPDVVIDGEVSRMIDQFKGDIAQVGGTWEGYLEHAKKTEEELRKEWRPDGEKRAKTQLILDAIGESENITPSKEDIEVHVAGLKRAYPETDVEQLKNYVVYTETNRLVVEFLEKCAEA